MKKCIDFDKRFALYTQSWIHDNRAKYKNADEMEADFPQVYLRWLNRPAKWLDGKSPVEYFASYTQPQPLCDLLCRYCSEGVAVPDLLLDRLVELGQESVAPLCALLSGQAHLEAKLCAVGLLTQLEDTSAFAGYIPCIAQAQEGDDLAERMADAMLGKKAAEEYKDALIAAYEGATARGKALLIDILAYMKNDERVFAILLDAFVSGEKKALYAGYLLKYGDDKALPALQRALTDPQTGYIDYIEIRNAVESLGGEVTVEREFAGDADYEALKNL